MSEHEARSSRAVAMGSERQFGLTFGIVFLVAAGYMFYRQQSTQAAAVLGGLSLLTFVLTFAAPRILRPLNTIWFKFGLLLHKIVSPIILGVLFYLVVTPVALLKHLFGSRSFAKSLDRKAASYWQQREKSSDPEQQRQRLRQQF